MGSLVSLVMTDIVDSTRRWNAAEGAMAADLEQHDQLLREAVATAGGTVCKHTGDGMIATFDDPVAAAHAAAGIQQAIGTAQWVHADGLRLRAALHTGVVYPRDGDVFGTAVNKVARILALCPPGAVLVSEAAAGLLADRPLDELQLQRIGAVSLAGFSTPDQTHALVGPGLAEVLLGDDAPTNEPARIPTIDDDLVGRTDELAAIWDALGRTRPVTLVGVGGMGKTRLALEVAAGALTTFDGAVWWVDLASATSAEAVIPVAMAAVGAREAPGRSPLQALCERFTGVTGLIVIDNCEHVRRAARELVSALRSDAPGISVVCTSREALGLRGEHLVPIGSLPGGDGTALFRERALAVRPDLDVAADAEVIERLCDRLDGIPLAIELAAARCRSMSPTEIDGLLGDRFRLLRGGRDGAERHRTLQAAVGWSHDLLDPDERVVFDQMAVFAGGTLADGLEAVTGLDRFDLLDVIDRLVARSMVVAVDTAYGTRYHQLETLRQYAEDRLVEAGTIDDVRNRHLAWAQQLTEALGTAIGVDAETTAVGRFVAEVDNLRVAVAHALDAAGPHGAHRVIAPVALLALLVPVYEVLDWARPDPANPQWTPESAVCAAHVGSADVYRGRGPIPLRSVEDLPTWWEVAPFEAKLIRIGDHLNSGGDPALAEALLDGLQPADVRGRVTVGSWRLMSAFFEGFSRTDHATTAPDRGLLELATTTVAAARQAGAAASYCFALIAAAYALGPRHPDLSSAYAREALVIADRLGIHALGNHAETALGFSRASLTRDVFIDRRDRAVAALRDRNLYVAGALAWSLLVPELGARMPDVFLRLEAVWARDFGPRNHGLMGRAGIAVPDDFDALSRAVADVSLPDAIRDVLEAADRLMAEGAIEGSIEGSIEGAIEGSTEGSTESGGPASTNP